MRNLRFALKKDERMLLSQSGINRSFMNQTLDNHSNVELDETIGDQEEQLKNDVAFLKTAIINGEQIETIKEKITSTMMYRVKMMNELKMDLLENFPYFFTNPELVCELKCFNLRIQLKFEPFIFFIFVLYRSCSIFLSGFQQLIVMHSSKTGQYTASD